MTARTATPASRSATAAPAEPTVAGGRAAAIYFALSLLYFLPAFMPGRHIFGTDYLQAGYFFYDFIHERIASGGLPKWVPYVLGGVPIFSNPGSTYYPVRWIADLLGSTRLFLPVLFWIQFGLSGWGMYLLARELGCRSWVAFVSGLAWQWTGITASWVYAGHDGRIIVVTLAPLVFCMLHRGIRTGRLAPFAGAAAAIGCALLSFQIQNAYYLLLGAALWAVFALVHLGVVRTPATLARTAAMGLLAVGFAFAMAAVNFLPFRDYVAESPRGMTGGRGYEFSTSYSMPVRAIVGVAVPEQVGVTVSNERGEYVFPVYRGENAFRLHTEYLGAFVLILATLGVILARRNRYVWFFGGLGLFALSLSLGGNTPLYRLYLATLPGLNRFRAPDLAYYLLAFSLACIAAIGLEAVATAREALASRRAGAKSDDRSLAPVLWVGAGWTGLAVLGAVAIGGTSGAMAEGTIGLTPALGWMRFALFAGGIAAALWMWTSGRTPSRVALVALSLIATADLWLIGKKFFQTVDGPETMYAIDDVTAFLQTQTQREPGRVLPLPQTAWPRFLDYPMYYDLELVGGEHGNNLQRYNDFVGTTPPAMLPDFHNLADIRFLAADNVRWLVAGGEINAPVLREAFRGATAIVYENTLALPRAYFVEQVVRRPEAQTLAAMRDSTWDPRRTAIVEAARDLPVGVGPLQAGARVTKHEPDEVVIQAQTSRAALMVLSDNYYKDWHATVDGRPVEIYRTNHTFRGVVVPAGQHTVRFVFEPKELLTGFYIYLATLVILAAYGAFLLVQRRRGAPAQAAA